MDIFEQLRQQIRGVLALSLLTSCGDAPGSEPQPSAPPPVSDPGKLHPQRVLHFTELRGYTFEPTSDPRLPNPSLLFSLAEAGQLTDPPGAPTACPPTLSLDALEAQGAILPGRQSKGSYTEYSITPEPALATAETPCAYQIVGNMIPGKGRPLQDQGEVVVAPAQFDHQNWSKPTCDPIFPDDKLVREQLATAWLRDAQVEHSSVAEFSRIVADLIGLGASPELLRDTLLAAQDEIRHAERCFELASFYAEEPLGPAPMALPPHQARSAKELAVRTFIDGCIEETLGALLAQTSAERCEDPILREILANTAFDESQHAGLAWRTLAWILQNSEDKAEILAEIRTIPLPDIHGNGVNLPQWGRLGLADQRSLRSRAWIRVVQPLLAELCGEPLEDLAIG